MGHTLRAVTQCASVSMEHGIESSLQINNQMTAMRDYLKQPTFEAISNLLQEFGFHVRHCEFVEAFVRGQRGRAKSAETERISDDRLSEILSPKKTWILEASIFE